MRRRAPLFFALSACTSAGLMLASLAQAIPPPSPTPGATFTAMPALPPPSTANANHVDPRGRTVPQRRPPNGRQPGTPTPPAPEQMAAAHGAEHEHEEEGPKPINWTDFDNKEQPPYIAMLVNFAVLAIIYVSFGKKPIAAALKARREEVSKQIEDAQKIKHEAEARSKQYASKLEHLTEELESTKAALTAAGAGERVRIVKEAEEKAVRMEKDADFLLAQERKQLERDLRREAVVAALADAEQLLKTKLTQADQERVAEEFLATLVPAKASSLSGGAGGAS